MPSPQGGVKRRTGQSREPRGAERGRLAVGSSFKLVLAAALQDLVVARKRKWSDVVTLLPAWRSLPSGILQTWPDWSFLTVQTLATLMISQSDNTAADAVLDLVGRTAAENISPTNRPFFSTRDLFVLKEDPANADLLATFRAGNEGQRRTVLAGLARYKLPAVSAISSKPTALDIDWLLSARELCPSWAWLQDRESLTPATGIASRTREARSLAC